MAGITRTHFQNDRRIYSRGRRPTAIREIVCSVLNSVQTTDELEAMVEAHLPVTRGMGRVRAIPLHTPGTRLLMPLILKF